MPDREEPDDADLGGEYARDTHRGGFGDDYAREGMKNATRPERSDSSDDVVEIGKASE